MKSKEFVFVDLENKQLVCQMCGETIPMPLGNLDWVSGVMKLFTKIHKSQSADHRKGLTYFQTNRKVEATKYEPTF